jgi:hypothetical protein
MIVFVAGIGLRGPGLDGWAASAPILRGAEPWTQTATVLPAPAMLPANERRRTSQVTRLALAVAQEAADMSGIPAAALRSIFGSSNGDGATIHSILDALSDGGAAVSPTQFHNSVHNAAAGYWSIGAGSSQAASCIGCHDATVGAGLLQAAAEAEIERRPVLLCLYDAPLPEPLGACRPMSGVFGAALVLSAQPVPGVPRLRVAYHEDPPVAEATSLPALDALRRTHPIARILPLLEMLASARFGSLSLALIDGRVDIDLLPPSPILPPDPVAACSTALAS